MVQSTAIQSTAAIQSTNAPLVQAIQLGNAGRFREAIPYLQRFLRLDPDHEEAWRRLGVCFFKIGQDDHAEGAFRRAVQVDAASFASFFFLGRVLERTGRVPEAITAYKHVLRIKPDFGEARQRIAALQPGYRAEAAGAAVGYEAMGGLVYKGYRRMRSYSSWFIFWILSLPAPPLFLLIGFILYLRSRTTRYEFYEGAIVVKKGILWKSTEVLWLFELTFKQSRTLSNLITRDSQILVLLAGSSNAAKMAKEQEIIAGFCAYEPILGENGSLKFRKASNGNRVFMETLFQQIVNTSLKLRQGIKGITT